MATDRQVPAVYDRVLEVVREIPYGRVATYGQIAMIVGGCTPRMVGYCMASLDPDSDVPWQRVINAQGKISPRGVGDGALRQRQLLIAEGVEFSDADRVSFRRFGWLDPALAATAERIALTLPAQPASIILPQRTTGRTRTARL